MCVACEEALISLPEVTVLPGTLVDVRPKLPRRREASVPATTLTLQPQQSVRILDAAGRPLLDIGWNEAGPVLQLAGSGAELDIAGPFRLSADSIDLLAHDGGLRMMAKDDVVVRGEKVRLN
jgi:hypothetical protein